MLQNKALTQISGPKGGSNRWLKINEKFHNLFTSPNTLREIESRRMKWAGHVAQMGDENIRRPIQNFSWNT
jgi:hypothetical protein